MDKIYLFLIYFIVIAFYGINGFFFKGLCNVVAHHMPNAEHRNCARHVYANWKKNWKDDEFKRLF